MVIAGRPGSGKPALPTACRAQPLPGAAIRCRHPRGICRNGSVLPLEEVPPGAIALVDEAEYRRQKVKMTADLEALVVPDFDAVREVRAVILAMPMLCTGAKLEERHRLLATVLDGVYVSFTDQAVVSVKLKNPFCDIVDDHR